MNRNDEMDACEDMAIRLRKCLDKAFLSLQEISPNIASSFETRTRSSILHDLMFKEIRAEFDQDSFTNFVEVRGLRHLTNSSLRVRVKKMNRRKLAARNRTRQSESWIRMPLPGIPELIPLHFGYLPDPTWTRVLSAGLVRQIGNQAVWFMEVSPSAQQDANPSTQPPTEIPVNGLRVKREVFETRQAELEGNGDGSKGENLG